MGAHHRITGLLHSDSQHSRFDARHTERKREIERERMERENGIQVCSPWDIQETVVPRPGVEARNRHLRMRKTRNTNTIGEGAAKA